MASKRTLRTSQNTPILGAYLLANLDLGNNGLNRTYLRYIKMTFRGSSLLFLRTFLGMFTALTLQTDCYRGTASLAMTRINHKLTNAIKYAAKHRAYLVAGFNPTEKYQPSNQKWSIFGKANMLKTTSQIWTMDHGRMDKAGDIYLWF